MCSVLVPHASAKLQNDHEAFQPGDMIRLTDWDVQSMSTYDNVLDQIWVKQNLAIIARCIVPDRKYARKKFLQRRNTLEPLCEDKKRAQVSTLLTDLGLLHYGYTVCDHSSVFLE
ncbi:hypothetical protein CY35_05G105000 [Sphagnum magellanicum]|nr:hypothetical protein CY35_05G105000 [Sphagnum magellanicum]KAH9563053.1 hypothetical protein CY35_05G105000 [Sphagnum magellanicum]